jgi:ubiquinone/menaquinone biosynthesis C-methylase UbiE
VFRIVEGWNMSKPSAPQPTGSAGLFSGQSFPELYEQALVGPLFAPWVEALLTDVGVAAGDRVLDVACGTGIVARHAKERVGKTGSVIGIDVNPQMLAVARRVAPTIDWREGDAASPPLGENEQVDVVLCQQGFQFFGDRAAAARQLRRALVQGGRLGVSTWRPDEEFPVLLELRRVAEEHVGAIADRRHSLGDTAPLETVLKEAGFEDVRAKIYTRTISFENGSAFLRLNAMALVSMSDARTEGEEERQKRVDAIVRVSEERLGGRMSSGALAYELGTNVVLAKA